MEADAEVVSQARSGNREAFGVLIARYQDHIYGCCRKLLEDPHEAQDATQDTFLRAYASLHQLKHPSRFAGWLRRIAFSVCMNRMKSLRPRDRLNFASFENISRSGASHTAPDPAEAAARRELTQILLQAIDKLPPMYRDPLKMSYLQHVSRVDIARSLGLSDSCVSTRLSRARKLLKNEVIALSPIEALSRSKEQRRWLGSELCRRGTPMELQYAGARRGLPRGDTEVSIRVMTQEDIPALRKFDRDLMAQLDSANAQVPPGRESTPGGPWSDDQWLAEHFDKYVEHGNITLLAEDRSARIVAFADLWATCEPSPFGTSLDVECIDYFRDYYYLGIETVLLQEAEKVAQGSGIGALDIGTNTSSGDYPCLRRLGMKVFYEYDNVTCPCRPTQANRRITHNALKPNDVDLTGLLRVSHWCPTDFGFREEAWIAELTWGDQRAVLGLWSYDPNSDKHYALSVPQHTPDHSELYAEPQALASSSTMSILIDECASLAGEFGAKEISFPCPSDIELDTSQVNVLDREFAFAWMRKELRRAAP